MNETRRHPKKEEQEKPKTVMGRPAKEAYYTRRWEVQLPFDLEKCLEELAPGAGFELMKEIVRSDPRIQTWIKAHEETLKPYKRPHRGQPKGSDKK